MTINSQPKEKSFLALWFVSKFTVKIVSILYNLIKGGIHMNKDEFTYCFNKLREQHEQIKAASNSTLFLLESYAENQFQQQQFTELTKRLQLLSRLTFMHFQTEEEMLIPILKQMYSKNEDISFFLQEQHSALYEKYNELIRVVASDPQVPFNEIDPDVSSLIHLHLEHIFVEEQGLFPLIQKYLNSNN